MVRSAILVGLGALTPLAVTAKSASTATARGSGFTLSGSSTTSTGFSSIAETFNEWEATNGEEQSTTKTQLNENAATCKAMITRLQTSIEDKTKKLEDLAGQTDETQVNIDELSEALDETAASITETTEALKEAEKNQKESQDEILMLRSQIGEIQNLFSNVKSTLTSSENEQDVDTANVVNVVSQVQSELEKELNSSLDAEVSNQQTISVSIETLNGQIASLKTSQRGLQSDFDGANRKNAELNSLTAQATKLKSNDVFNLAEMAKTCTKTETDLAEELQALESEEGLIKMVLKFITDMETASASVAATGAAAFFQVRSSTFLANISGAGASGKATELPAGASAEQRLAVAVSKVQEATSLAEGKSHLYEKLSNKSTALLQLLAEQQSNAGSKDSGIKKALGLIREMLGNAKAELASATGEKAQCVKLWHQKNEQLKQLVSKRSAAQTMFADANYMMKEYQNTEDAEVADWKDTQESLTGSIDLSAASKKTLEAHLEYTTGELRQCEAILDKVEAYEIDATRIETKRAAVGMITNLCDKLRGQKSKLTLNLTAETDNLTGLQDSLDTQSTARANAHDSFVAALELKTTARDTSQETIARLTDLVNDAQKALDAQQEACKLFKSLKEEIAEHKEVITALNEAIRILQGGK